MGEQAGEGGGVPPSKPHSGNSPSPSAPWQSSHSPSMMSNASTPPLQHQHPESRNLYIHNVPRDATEEILQDLFSTCGPIESVSLRTNLKVGPHAVYAFVLYKNLEDARKCHVTLNGTQLMGRTIRVEYQRPHNNSPGNQYMSDNWEGKGGGGGRGGSGGSGPMYGGGQPRRPSSQRHYSDGKSYSGDGYPSKRSKYNDDQSPSRYRSSTSPSTSRIPSSSRHHHHSSSHHSRDRSEPSDYNHHSSASGDSGSGSNGSGYRRDGSGSHDVYVRDRSIAPGTKRGEGYGSSTEGLHHQSNHGTSGSGSGTGGVDGTAPPYSRYSPHHPSHHQPYQSHIPDGQKSKGGEITSQSNDSNMQMLQQMLARGQEGEQDIQAALANNSSLRATLENILQSAKASASSHNSRPEDQSLAPRVRISLLDLLRRFAPHALRHARNGSTSNSMSSSASQGSNAISSTSSLATSPHSNTFFPPSSDPSSRRSGRGRYFGLESRSHEPQHQHHSRDDGVSSRSITNERGCTGLDTTFSSWMAPSSGNSGGIVTEALSSFSSPTSPSTLTSGAVWGGSSVRPSAESHQPRTRPSEASSGTMPTAPSFVGNRSPHTSSSSPFYFPSSSSTSSTPAIPVSTTKAPHTMSQTQQEVHAHIQQQPGQVRARQNQQHAADDVPIRDRPVVWRGELARNEKKRVGVEVRAISGDVGAYLKSTLKMLNVSHRSKWEEISSRRIVAATYVEAESAGNDSSLQEYINYFNAKDRGGVAPLDQSHFFYLLPLGKPVANQYIPSGLASDRPALLGLIGPSQVIGVGMSGGAGAGSATTSILSSQASKQGKGEQTE